MQLSDFKFDLPQELIAQYPLRQRDQARLLVVDRKTQSITHDIFKNLNRYLPKKSILVLNESKVVPARLFGHKERSGGAVEIFLLKKLSDGYSFEALLRPRPRIKDGDKIMLNGSGLYAYVENKEQGIVRFNKKNITRYLSRIGHIPLPPYIHRDDEPLDKEYYQTVYAKNAGSVASPTAGLHFTESLLARLAQAGHSIQKLTLHVNYSTFKPVVETDIRNHTMHPEEYSISRKAFSAIAQGKTEKRSIVAVGTTSCRTLEAIAATKKLKGSTDLFVYPGYTFKMVDCLITNFHLPLSTLLMLVSAFGGYDLVLRAYQEAVKEKYRFYSYGDGMLIL